MDNDRYMNFDDMEMNGEIDIDGGDMVQEEFMTPNLDSREVPNIVNWKWIIPIQLHPRGEKQ